MVETRLEAVLCTIYNFPMVGYPYTYECQSYQNFHTVCHVSTSVSATGERPTSSSVPPSVQQSVFSPEVVSAGRKCSIFQLNARGASVAGHVLCKSGFVIHLSPTYNFLNLLFSYHCCCSAGSCCDCHNNNTVIYHSQKERYA